MKLNIPFKASFDLAPEWRGEAGHHLASIIIVLLDVDRLGHVHMYPTQRFMRDALVYADVALAEVAVAARAV